MKCTHCDGTGLSPFNPLVSCGPCKARKAFGVSATERMIREAELGFGPVLGMTQNQLNRLVRLYAPFDADARDRFFVALRSYADRTAPCYPRGGV